MPDADGSVSNRGTRSRRKAPLPTLGLRRGELLGLRWALVVTTRPCGPVDPRDFDRACKARIQRAGVHETTVHATRKACAPLWVALDVHPRLAMAILRHSQTAVTMEIYSEVTSAKTLDALRRLGDQFDQ